MTAVNGLELAKQGNPKAIAALMNKTLQPKGITVTANVSGSCLTIVAEADTALDQSVLMDFIRQGITSLSLKSIDRLVVQGKVKGEKLILWRETVELQVKFKLGSTQKPITVIGGNSKSHKATDVVKWLLPVRECANTLLLGAIFLTVLGGSWNANRTEPQFWEYQVVAVEDTTFEMKMQRLGAEGWELASARRALAGEEYSRQGIYEVIFRRSITKAQAQNILKTPGI